MDPRVVVNGLTGERIVFGDYGTEDGIEYLEIVEGGLGPGEDGPPAHAHLVSEEVIEVVAGRLGVRVDGEEAVLGPGEAVSVEPGAVHEWWNAGDDTLRMRGRVWNPGRFEEALTTVFALVNHGRATARGTPRPLDGAVWIAAYGDEYEASFIPKPIRWIAATLLAPLARTLGHHVPVEYVEPGPAVESSVTTPASRSRTR